MSKNITIAGQKGGTGKSVTAVNLAVSMALLEKTTLLIDCDPQGCATEWCGIRTLDYNCDITSVLSGKVKFTDAVVKTQFNCLDMVPAGFNLFQTALRLARNPGNEKILRLFLKDVADEYEYIIIDSPSSYNFLSVAAMTAADWLLVCMTPQYSGFEDFSCLLRMVKHIRSSHDVPLKIAGLLFNRCKGKEEIRTFLEAQGLEDVEKLVCQTFIPETDAIRESIDLKIPAALKDVKSRASQAYLGLANEMHVFFTQRGGV